jgi:hypothetical protein
MTSKEAKIRDILMVLANKGMIISLTNETIYSKKAHKFKSFYTIKIFKKEYIRVNGHKKARQYLFYKYNVSGITRVLINLSELIENAN